LGGVGGYGAYTLSQDGIINIINELNKATNKPYNINLWVSDTDTPAGLLSDADYQKVRDLFRPYFEELGIAMPDKAAPFSSRFENQAEVVLHGRPPVFSFTFGIPSPALLEQCRKQGIITMGSATTLDEAIALEAAGVDMIVASGFEAGSAGTKKMGDGSFLGRPDRTAA
jgi:nitronate monooxygenase